MSGFSGRREDRDLVRGLARFTADLAFDGLHAVFVRSPVSHGRIRAVDVDAALQAPGVVAVHVADTIGLPPFEHVPGPDCHRSPLAAGIVRHVGEAVAVVLAATIEQAVDAVDLVDVDIERLAPIVDPADSATGPLLYPGTTGNRVHRSPAVGDDPIEGADLVVDLRVANPKVSSLTLECDAIVATPDGGRLDVWCTSQGVHQIRDELVAGLGLDPATLRVRSPHVGGGFGGRATMPIEFAVVARAAQLLGRPVRWIQTRGEALVTQTPGRGITTDLRLGVADDGSLVGLDAALLADAGCARHMAGPLLTSAERQLAGLYRWRVGVRSTSEAWLTTSAPVGAYRGAGQPEANHARERAIDVAARRMRLDPIEFRLATLVGDDTRPRQPHGVDYDLVAPGAALRRAVAAIDLDHWRAEAAGRVAARSPRRIGIGVACYAQTSGRGSPEDQAEIRLHADGRVEVRAGSPAHGQGHEHTFANLIAARLGVDPGAVTLVDADTAVIDDALTTGGSRATQVLGQVLDEACDQLVDEARAVVSAQLEVGVDDLIVVPAGYDRGAGLAVIGVPTKRVEWVELAREEPNRCLAMAHTGGADGEAHPFGAHVSIVEVDIETGGVTVLDHVAADDVGTVLEPELVEGQQHGGSVAGIAQALGEAIRFDEQGNPTAGTLGSYLVPGFGEVPPIRTVQCSTPTDRNSLGTRGIGENGCNGATAAVHNAVMDTLWDFGIEHLDLPLDPEVIAMAVAGSDQRR